jgi:serine phosphatase RsbU (regulator of sigma subunit)
MARYEPPRCQGHAGAQIAFRRIPGAGFGGDFHSVFLSPEGRLSFVVGTVLEGGLMASFAKAVLAGEAARLGSAQDSPAGIWDCFSRSLARINADARHRVECAVFHGSLDRHARRFEYRSTRRIIPIAIGPARNATDLSLNAPALGHPQSAAALMRSVDLTHVSRLVLLTDGLAGALSPDGRRLRDAIGLEAIAQSARLDPEAQADVLVRRLREHVGANFVFTEDATVFIADFALPARRRGTGVAELLRRSRAIAFDDTVDSSVFIG